jgi:hypothetical protein
VSEQAWDQGGGSWSWGPGKASISVTLPVSLHGVARYDRIEAAVETRANSWTVVNPLGFDSMELVLVESVPEIVAARQIKASSGGLIVGYEDLENTSMRQQAVSWAGNPDRAIKVTALILDVFAKAQGARVVDFDDNTRRAVVAKLSQDVQDLRGRLAALMGAQPWDVELTLEHASGPGVRPFVSTVSVGRSPIASRDPEKRRAFWLDQATSILQTPAGYMWRHAENALTGMTTLSCIHDPLEAVIPYSADPTTQIEPHTPWRIGADEDGEPVEIDLAASAHMLVAGATRSGKSVTTYSLLTHILRMGDSVRLLVADPNDTTVAPFEPLVSWSTSSTHPGPVTEMLEWVRLEMDRRKPIMREMRLDKISDFSPEMPLIVIVLDEAANYLKHSDKPAALELAGEMQAVAAQGAKYGVRLVIITQRPSADILPPAVRSQLSARISFRMEDKEGAVMAFPDIDDPSELLSYKTGVGIFREVGGKLRRFRAEYLADHWAAADQIPAALPRITIGRAAGPERVTKPARPSSPPPEIVDAGAITFTLEDLEPAVAAEFAFTLDD